VGHRVRPSHQVVRAIRAELLIPRPPSNSSLQQPGLVQLLPASASRSRPGVPAARTPGLRSRATLDALSLGPLLHDNYGSRTVHLLRRTIETIGNSSTLSADRALRPSQQQRATRRGSELHWPPSSSREPRPDSQRVNSSISSA